MAVLQMSWGKDRGSHIVYRSLYYLENHDAALQIGQDSGASGEVLIQIADRFTPATRN